MYAEEPVDHTVTRWLLTLATGLLSIPAIVVVAAVAIAAGLWWLWAVLVAVVVGVGLAAALVWRRARVADKRVLAALGDLDSVPDDPADPATARFRNLVDGLCLSIGVAEPDLRVLPSDTLNAMVVATGPNQTVVVTRSLMEQLDRLELEGVVAELLIRLRNGDAERSTLVAALFGQPLVEGAWAEIFAPVTTVVYDRVIDKHRDIAADVQAVGVTRYPPGLRAGLEHIARAADSSESVDTVPAEIGPGLDHLWIVPPGRARHLFDFAPLEWRIDVLQEI